MATIANFDSSGSVRIEVDGDNAASAYGGEFARALQTITETVASLVSQIASEQRPQELRLTCGLKALPGGGFAVTLDTVAANFNLSLTWRSDSDQGLLGGIVPQSETGLGL